MKQAILKTTLLAFVFAAIFACKNKDGVNFFSLPNGKYTATFVNDSFPKQNYVKEFIGVKGYWRNKGKIWKNSVMTFTSSNKLDSSKQESIELHDYGAYYYTTFNHNIPVSYNISLSKNTVRATLVDSADIPYAPTSFTLTYTP